MRAALAFALVAGVLSAGVGAADSRMQSSCIALAGMPEALQLAEFGAPLAAATVRIRFLGHASFALETAGGLLAVTDYTGFIGNPMVVPDAVTMNIAHDTHFTDPLIPHVLRGWGRFGFPAVVDLDLGDLRIRNVTTDLRGPFGEGGRKDGNSIFIFEAAGLCIVHLGHLHQIPNPVQYANIGRVDVVMVPVDGGFTMTQDAMIDVVGRLHARVVIPMHWFTLQSLHDFLAKMEGSWVIEDRQGPELEVSLGSLPARPTVVLLTPALFP